MVESRPQCRVERLTLRDGIELVADVWQPAGEGLFPVLLMRQAYGRRIGTSLCYAPPEWYAAHGYIVVIQDVRGRGESGGTFDLFMHEAQDGTETIDWAAALPGSNGRVGMFGFSFQGSNQLLAAAKASSALKALAPAMIGWDFAQDWAFEGGAFALRANLGWATQLAAETARLAGNAAAHETLFAASRGLSFSGPKPAFPAHDALLARHSHYATWRDTAPDNPYWQHVSPAAHLPAIAERGAATLLIGGWYDSHFPGTLAAYRALNPLLPTRLLVGPWAHFPWDRKIGALDFGPDAVTDIDRQQIAWFDHWLKDAPAREPTKGVRLFDMGASCWREFPDFPSQNQKLSLSGTGRAAIDMRDGVLGKSDATAVTQTERLTLDPWRPCAPCGGSFGYPPGPMDRAQTDARSDVLTFTSAAFTAPAMLAGDVALDVMIETEHASFDLHAVLSRVTITGEAYPLAEGYATLAPGKGTVAMRATCCTLAVGECLRLSLSPACFPSFPVNPGTGMPPLQAGIADQQVVILNLLRSGSQLHLPLHQPE